MELNRGKEGGRVERKKEITESAFGVCSLYATRALLFVMELVGTGV